MAFDATSIHASFPDLPATTLADLIESRPTVGA